MALTNCGTSVFAGFAVFSLLGFMATQLNREVQDVVDAGIAFVKSNLEYFRWKIFLADFNLSVIVQNSNICSIFKL